MYPFVLQQKTAVILFLYQRVQHSLFRVDHPFPMGLPECTVCLWAFFRDNFQPSDLPAMKLFSIGKVIRIEKIDYSISLKASDKC